VAVAGRVKFDKAFQDPLVLFKGYDRSIVKNRHDDSIRLRKFDCDGDMGAEWTVSNGVFDDVEKHLCQELAIA